MSPKTSKRPIMDVAAPRRSVAQAAAAPADIKATTTASKKTVVASAAKVASKAINEEKSGGMPAGVITVAILSLMLLAVVGVIVYVTSQAN